MDPDLSHIPSAAESGLRGTHAVWKLLLVTLDLLQRPIVIDDQLSIRITLLAELLESNWKILSVEGATVPGKEYRVDNRGARFFFRLSHSEGGR